MNIDMKEKGASWVVGHEGGHLMGLGDKYVDSVKKTSGGNVIVSIPNAGYEHNVMGAWGETGVKENQITQIIGANH